MCKKVILYAACCVLRMSAALALPLLDHGEESLDKFEGDMILSFDQKLALAGYRNGLAQEQFRWPNNKLFYRIVPDNFTSEQMDYIRKALDTIEEVSCLKIEEADDFTEAYVQIVGDDGGCFSEVGYQGEVQVLNLAPNKLENGCFRLGTIIHEFLHALGFFHMQSSADRDDYVEIVWDNIQPGTEHNFAKYNSSFVSNFDIVYDYGSVMHYPEMAFSVNGLRTIIPLDPEATIGQREGMSPSDVAKLRRMYRC
ncbi:seminal metalloprotease 1 [Culex quinquefasciatus]|uniref:seminal metalloprotease 1 n=1 Tax=Culex quinquefasciatus TaxID=7176 RepID=UPI0018E3C5EF|nr:seminal metalloprotease 1 [Culex quinquefasciatus]